MAGNDPRTEQPIDAGGWQGDHLREYVATGGAEGHDWRRGAPTLLLTTRGRRSGRLRRTPLIYGRHGHGYVVVASYGGSPEHPDWYHNLVADPDVAIQVRDEVITGTARTAGPEEKPGLWEQMTRIWPDYDAYQERTDRDIPVVVIEPS
jgi:deazaflavin-dependent oxidoreductase (nitroreductase family)